MINCAVIIPVLNPTESLIEYVKTLANDVQQIIVINDGSKQELVYIFTELTNISRCTVLTHEINKGKGRALKTAFQYFLTDHSELNGVITADADGQHSIPDVVKLAEELSNTEEEIILGVRDFSQSHVPVRSYIGNRITSSLFQLFYGGRLEDTQTGLRGIPNKVLSQIVELKGERYEYEMNMLIFAKKRSLQLREIPIQTLYFDNNAGSHYNSVLDSMKVFIKLISGLLKYSFSTLASGVVDILSFILLTSLLLAAFPLKSRLFFAILVARILSSSFNFYLNRKLVFRGENKLSESIVKYYILFIGLIIASYLLVLSANLLIGANVILAKICIDTILGILSYQVQLHWVFKNRNKKLNKKLAGENHDI
jgi:glycosyltransferase involved in cell wall biosynthesis